MEKNSFPRTIKAVIRLGNETGYIAECYEIGVVTQGATLDEVTRNLQKATALHLEGENLKFLGLVNNPALDLRQEF